MIRSMTGYGRAEGRHKRTPITVEIRSVNHRHSEVVAKVPRALQAHEDRIRNLVQSRVARGRVDVAVNFSGERDPGRGLVLDRALARRYLALLKELQRDLGLKGTPDVALLAGFRDIIKPAEPAADDPGAARAAEKVVAQALKALDRMRRHEGRTLERDLLARLKEIVGRLQVVRLRLPGIVQERQARLQERVNRLLAGARLPVSAGGGKDGLDQSRVAQEVALLVDRSDVSEELTRLGSHLDQFRNFLRKAEPVGRSLDFLLQEMNREVNTIGSKVGDTTVTQEIVWLKAEFEKLREQVQNVE